MCACRNDCAIKYHLYIYHFVRQVRVNDINEFSNFNRLFIFFFICNRCGRSNRYGLL